MDKDNNLFEMVREFNLKFGIPLNDKPGYIDYGELLEIGCIHLREEVNEFISSRQLIDNLDALVDIVYVAMGLAAKYGFDFNEAFRRVHAANMTKTRAQSSEESKRYSAWDIIKGPDFVPADLEDLV